MLADAGCEDDCVWQAEWGEVTSDEFGHLITEGFKSAEGAGGFGACVEFADV